MRVLIPPDTCPHTTMYVCAQVERADTDARSILSAVRAAIDGPDWRVFKVLSLLALLVQCTNTDADLYDTLSLKDGKLVQNAHEWHHDSIIIER
jgi:hypothetical protein